MADRTCTNCKHKFKYPNLLKNHFKNAYHCLLTEDEINTFYNNINNNILNNNEIINNNNNIINDNNNIDNNILNDNEIINNKIINNDNEIINNNNNITNDNEIINNNNNIINDNEIINNNNINNINKCIKCNKTFNNKKSLTRHHKETKCGKSQQINQQTVSNQINNNVTTIISSLSPELQAELQTEINKIILQQQAELTKTILQQITNNIPINNPITNPIINNTTNNNDNNHHNTQHTDNSNTLNQNTLNQNITINNHITHIMPFGYERLPNIPQSRMKQLLTLGDEGVIEIVKLVCEQDENKNFYKLNMNKSNISYLNKEYKVNICQESELKEKLLKQCVVLTYQMFVACSPILSNYEIEYINSNLQNISKKMKEEIYDNGLRNIIEYELRNNSKITKDRITKYTEVINSYPEVKQKAISNCIEVLKKKEDNKHKLKPYFTIKRINRILGYPLEHTDMNEEEAFTNFALNRFEDTKYYKYWIKRIKDETKLINKNPNKTITDIVNLDRRKKNINVKLQYMKEINDIIGTFDANDNPIITLEKFYVKIADEYTIENNKKQNMGERYNYNSEEDEEDDEDSNSSSNTGIANEEEEVVSISSY